MPDENPFRAEIQKLSNEADELFEEAMAAFAGGDTAKANKLSELAQKKQSVQDDLLRQSLDWREGRIDSALAKLDALAKSELAKQANVSARLKKLAQRLGIGGAATKTPATGASDEPESVSAPPAPLTAASGPGASAPPISIGDTELDALQRVTMSEVGHFAKHGQDQLTGGVQAVVETILNRVANIQFPASIFDVVDQPAQFSAINPVGSWSNLPTASDAVAGIVSAYVTGRVGGAAGILGGATHFLNPHLSSTSAMNNWGKHVVDNAIAVFGNDAKKDVHFHGFAPGTPLPRAYTLTRGTASAAFNGDGTPIAGGALAVNTRSRILSICDAEFQFFESGAKKESDDPQFLRVGDYWRILGLPYNGRTQVENKKTGKTYNPPWSSAYISFVMSEAGLSSRFRLSQAHCHYVQAVVKGLPNSAFAAEDPDEYTVKPGDIVHYGREWAKGFDFAEAKAAYLSDSFYPSHSDIVVSVDAAAGTAATIGGNVVNSVGRKSIPLNPDGSLKPRRESGSDFPWIAVLSLGAP